MDVRNDSESTCKVDVRATKATFVKDFGNHLFIVYTDLAGAQYHYEALPGNYPFPWGSIKTWQGLDAHSKVGATVAGPTTVASGVMGCGKDRNGKVIPGFGQGVVQGPHKCFLNQMACIDKAAITYNFLSTNSNAFVWTILSNCNITPRKPTSD